MQRYYEHAADASLAPEALGRTSSYYLGTAVKDHNRASVQVPAPPRSVFALAANGNKVRRPTFELPKCCAMHEWQVRRAATQHLEQSWKSAQGRK